MNHEPRKRPSIGFVTVVIIYLLVIAFFLWGFSTPDLDRVWTLHHELKIGKTNKLKKADRKILLNSMAHHPDLARALLSEGEIGMISSHTESWIATPCATILRTPESKKYDKIRFDIHSAKEYYPYSIEVKGTAWTEKLSIKQQGLVDLQLPKPPKTAEIITVELKGRDFEPDPSMLGVHISFKSSTNL